MPQYSAAPRSPFLEARQRRMYDAFQPPAAGVSLVNTRLLANSTVQYSASTGNPLLVIEDDGVNFTYKATTIVNANVKFTDGDLDQINSWLAFDPAADITVKLADAVVLVPDTGSWIGFYSVDSGASTYTLTIDPDNVNTGYSINGSTNPITAINTAFGSVILFYDSRYSNNWTMIRHRGVGSLPSSGDISAVAANTTVTSPTTTVLMTTGAADKKVTLPAASTYEGTTLLIAKVDSGAGGVLVDPAGSDKINGSATNRTIYDQYGSLSLLSDGTDWLIAGSTGFWAGRGQTIAANANTTITPPTETLLVTTGASNLVITLPAAGSEHYVDKLVTVQKDDSGAGKITIDGNGAELIDGSANTTIYGHHTSVSLRTDGSGWYTVGGSALGRPGVGGSVAVVTNADHTVVWPERYVLVTTGASDRTITLPDTGQYAFAAITIKKLDAGAGKVIIDGAGADTIDGAANTNATAQYESFTLLSSNSADWHTISHFT